MKHTLLWLAAILGLLLLTSQVSAVLTRHQVQGPVYTVDEVTTLLTRNPRAWVGRTVLVRGVAEPCLESEGPARFLQCHHRPGDFLDPGLAGASGHLPLVSGAQSTWLIFLRHLPLVSLVLPPQQTPQWGDTATYRVQLQTMPGCSYSFLFCYEALLLDAAP